jgi:3',5'-cyclic AMP phosphodiesterase CpdA
MKKPLTRRFVAFARHFYFAVIISIFIFVVAPSTYAQVTIAQISDTHLGEVNSTHAAENLCRAVDMINALHPDAVVLSGDIGENPEEWQRARQILKGLKAPLYYAPGNHDVHTNDVAEYRSVFGPDYYRFRVKGVTFLVIDSQLLGNYDKFGLPSLEPMPASTEAEGEKMLAWLSHPDSGRDADDSSRHGNRDRDRDNDRRDADDSQTGENNRDRKIIVGIQHIPVYRAENLIPDPKPYWVITEPYRSREMDLLHKLGVKHMLVGHWHVGGVFERDGITWHVAPSTSRMLPWSGQLGFAMHTISPNGDVKTEFVSLGTDQ